MFLIYVDESGVVSNPAENVFVLGAASIYENQAYFLTQELDKIQQKWFPSSTVPIEFHASHIRNGIGEPWHSMNKTKRMEILTEICTTIAAANPKGLVLFGIAIQKKSFQTVDVVEKAFEELCGHTDAYISTTNTQHLATGKDKNRGLMILDSSKYEGQLDKLLLAYRQTGGTSFGKVKNFADAPTFANSATTRLLQIADIVSYAIYRRYEKSDARLLDILLPRFHEKDGKIHGLMHLVTNYRSCSCIACVSRRA